MNENCTNKNSSSRRVIKITRNSPKLKSESAKSQNNGHKSLLEKSGNQQRKQQQTEISLLNCDNKINHCNRYDVSDGLFSGHSAYRNRKLSIDDESSHPINASNTNNKIERKRNINMLNDISVNEDCSVGCKEVQQNVDDDDGDVVIVGGGNTKRMKVDCDGQDNNKSKMYQVSIRTTKKKEKKNERKGKKKKIFFDPPFVLIHPLISSRFYFLCICLRIP